MCSCNLGLRATSTTVRKFAYDTLRSSRKRGICIPVSPRKWPVYACFETTWSTTVVRPLVYSVMLSHKSSRTRILRHRCSSINIYTGDAWHIQYVSKVSWPGAVPHARRERLVHPGSSVRLGPESFVTGVVRLASTKYTGDARHIHYVSWPGAVRHARHEPLFHPESSLQLPDRPLENTTKSCQSPIFGGNARAVLDPT